MAIRKFKHYATNEEKEFEVKNGHVNINNKWYKLDDFNRQIKASNTSWVLIKNG